MFKVDGWAGVDGSPKSSILPPKCQEVRIHGQAFVTCVQHGSKTYPDQEPQISPKCSICQFKPFRY